jgi:hypothetical protein
MCSLLYEIFTSLRTRLKDVLRGDTVVLSATDGQDIWGFQKAEAAARRVATSNSKHDTKRG